MAAAIVHASTADVTHCGWHGPDMTVLADEIGDDPMLFPLLDRLQSQRSSSRRRKPQPMSMASIAWSRIPRDVAKLRVFEQRRPCSAVSQFPSRTPIRRTLAHDPSQQSEPAAANQLC
jgi:hypothetical protein